MQSTNITHMQDSHTAEFYTVIDEIRETSTHFNENFEILIVLDGVLNCTVNEQSHSVSQGNALFICPLQLHKFDNSDNAKVRIIGFNDNIILTVAQSLDGRIPKSPVFAIEKSTLDFALDYFNNTFGEEHTTYQIINPYANRIGIKGILYLLTGEFLKTAELIQMPKSDTVAMEIALYISQNYRNNISLRTIAREKGYNYQYLSRTFNRYMNTNFKRMLNQHRAKCALAMLQDTNFPISYVGLECGFQSVRSFNQVCLDTFGKTPKQIRLSRRI